MRNEAAYKQFPLRLSVTLYSQLEDLSTSTRINKTTIIRLALRRFVDQINKTGLPITTKEIFG